MLGVEHVEVDVHEDLEALELRGDVDAVHAAAVERDALGALDARARRA